jgi:hypothetical protein
MDARKEINDLVTGGLIIATFNTERVGGADHMPIFGSRLIIENIKTRKQYVFDCKPRQSDRRSVERAVSEIAIRSKDEWLSNLAPVMNRHEMYSLATPVMNRHEMYSLATPVVDRHETYDVSSPVLNRRQIQRVSAPVIRNSVFSDPDYIDISDKTGKKVLRANRDIKIFMDVESIHVDNFFNEYQFSDYVAVCGAAWPSRGVKHPYSYYISKSMTKNSADIMIQVMIVKLLGSGTDAFEIAILTRDQLFATFVDVVRQVFKKEIVILTSVDEMMEMILKS